MITRLENISCGTACQAGADRYAIGQTFCQRHDVRVYAVMLVCKPFAGAAHPGLDLVEHQQPALVVAQLAQAGQEVGGRDVDAALTLDRLDQHRDHVRLVLGDGTQRIEVAPGLAILRVVPAQLGEDERAAWLATP